MSATLKANTKAKGKQRLISNDIYQSYLLRFWRDSPHSTWRAPLQSTATNEKYIFAETDALFEFLDLQLRIDTDPAVDGSSSADDTTI